MIRVKNAYESKLKSKVFAFKSMIQAILGDKFKSCLTS